MTPEQRIKRAILLDAAAEGCQLPDDVNASNVDELFESRNSDGELQDYIYEMRSGKEETNITAPLARHYESKSVAANLDGVWVGWTYWYGGGKHGEPEAIDWMEEAYELTCVEEEKTVTVRTFTQV